MSSLPDSTEVSRRAPVCETGLQRSPSNESFDIRYSISLFVIPWWSLVAQSTTIPSPSSISPITAADGVPLFFNSATS